MSRRAIAAVLGGVALVVLAAVYFLLWPALFGGSDETGGTFVPADVSLDLGRKQPVSAGVSLDQLAYERIGDFTLMKVKDKGGDDPEGGGWKPGPRVVDDAYMNYACGDKELRLYPKTARLSKMWAQAS